LLKRSIFISLLFLLLISCGESSSSKNLPIAELVSHRGLNENKLDGFLAAIIYGYRFVEADVRIRDGIPILLHDDIDCLDCTTLVELLELAEQKDITLFLEFKEFKAIDESLELISQFNLDVVLLSNDADALIYINSVSNYSLGYITLSDYDLTSLPSIDYLLIDHSHIDKCVEGIKCVAWTVTKKNQYDKLKYKVDYVIADLF
jgi:glycerophosphoryl diester phosphodiesterase